MIGCWGSEVVFEVSEDKVYTFKDLQRTVSAEYATHSRVGDRAEMEFLHPNLQELQFTMILDATQGVRPRDILELLERNCEAGTVAPLVLGGKRIGKNDWALLSVGEAWEVIYNGGELARANVDVSMKEYV